jgi:hypothetical protein
MTNNEILMTKELLMTKSFGRRAARVSGRKAGAPLAGWAAGCLPLRLGRRSRGKRRTEGADWSKFGVAGPPLSAKVRKSPPLSAFAREVFLWEKCRAIHLCPAGYGGQETTKRGAIAVTPPGIGLE